MLRKPEDACAHGVELAAAAGGIEQADGGGQVLQEGIEHGFRVPPDEDFLAHFAEHEQRGQYDAEGDENDRGGHFPEQVPGDFRRALDVEPAVMEILRGRGGNAIQRLVEDGGKLRPVPADADPYGQTVGRHRGDDNLGDIIQPYDVGSRVEDFKDGVDLPPFQHLQGFSCGPGLHSPDFRRGVLQYVQQALPYCGHPFSLHILEAIDERRIVHHEQHEGQLKVWPGEQHGFTRFRRVDGGEVHVKLAFAERKVQPRIGDGVRHKADPERFFKPVRVVAGDAFLFPFGRERFERQA